MPKTVVTAVLILLVTIGAAANADAQSDNTGNPSILKAVQDLQQSVDALSSQVNNISTQGTNVTSQLNSIMTKLTSITTQLDAISAPPATIATSALGKGLGFSAGCTTQNISSSSITVNVDLMKIDGQVQQSFPNLVLGPHNGLGFFQAIGSLAGNFWCRFTPVSGTSAQIRGNLGVINEVTGMGLFLDAR